MLRAYLLVGVAVVSAATLAGERDDPRNTLVGKTPPALVAADADWHVGPPTTLGKLKGKVVWLQFNF